MHGPQANWLLIGRIIMWNQVSCKFLFLDIFRASHRQTQSPRMNHSMLYTPSIVSTPSSYNRTERNYQMQNLRCFHEFGCEFFMLCDAKNWQTTKQTITTKSNKNLWVFVWCKRCEKKIKQFKWLGTTINILIRKMFDDNAKHMLNYTYI